MEPCPARWHEGALRDLPGPGPCLCNNGAFASALRRLSLAIERACGLAADRRQPSPTPSAPRIGTRDQCHWTRRVG
eukprot:1963901-Alexandrium_andersonii.AAC.1